MLDPEYLAQLPEPILRLWRKAEQQILADMARRISTYDYWIPAADHQSARLRAAGHTQEEILAALAPVTKKSEAELQKMMIDAGSRCLADDAELYHAAGLDVPDPAKHSGLTATLNTGYQQTAQTMRNLTRSTARTATQQFERVLDRAWLQVNSGAFDYDSAIRGAIKDLAEAGISAIRYPSGRTDSIETAIRRAVLTGVNQTAGKLSMELADEVGCDLVEVSAHAGARPEHALWQGKIYSRSGKSDKYPDFVSSTGYGTGAGLCGWNCRHSFGPYVEGAPRVWTDEKLAELNEPKYEYRGEQLTEYEAEQLERRFERNIHRWNREADALKAAGQDASAERAKAAAWRARKRDFLENRKQIAAPTIPEIHFDSRVSSEQKALIQNLASQYNTNLKTVTIGSMAQKGSGNVNITGQLMRLSDKHEDVAVHEFAHTLAVSQADKVGLTDNKDFWQEIAAIKRKYHRDVDKDPDTRRWISTYEHSSRSIDEFMAEAFAHAKMKELSLAIPAHKYGKDFTYSRMVLNVVDKYFKRK